jgi:ADP-ribose pyrophosphatase
MPTRIRAIEKLTQHRWINLYETRYEDRAGAERRWMFASRRPAIAPTDPDAEADAVVVVPVLLGPQGRRLVMTKEFRVPIRAYEYGFPAGLMERGESHEDVARRELKEETGLDLTRVVRVSPRLYSSPGMVDECAVMVFAECTGEPSTLGAEATEDIEVLVLDHAGLCRIADDTSLHVSAKAWPVLYLYQQLGTI